MEEVHKGEFWIGVFRHGLFIYNRFTDTNEFDLALQSSTTRAIEIDEQSNVWVATNYGLLKIDRDSKKIINYTKMLKNKLGIKLLLMSQLAIDGDLLWIGTLNHGLVSFDVKKLLVEQYRLSMLELDRPVKINALLVDNERNLWIGSSGRGVYKYSKLNLVNYQMRDGLSDNTVWNIEQDLLGNLWFFTENGLSQLSPVSEKFTNYYQSDGLQNNAFTQAGYYDRSNDIMITGGVNGFNWFSPGELEVNDKFPPLRIVSFSLFNKTIRANFNDLLPMQRSITHTRDISLSHQQNEFSFKFAALEYDAPNRIQYAYKLEGYEDHWNYVKTSNRLAKYTNIQYGDYTFRVKSTNKSGQWNPQQTSISLSIATPWWSTQWAYTVYILLCVISLFLLVQFRTQVLMRRAQQLEGAITQRTLELADEKHKVEQLLSRKNE